MWIPLLAGLLGVGHCVLASPDGPADQVTALATEAPLYAVGPGVSSTSTLYTTSYFTITECARGAADCLSNTPYVVTSAVFATTTTTLCLVTTSPDLGVPSGQPGGPEGSPTASLTASISTAAPSATETWSITTAVNSNHNLPSGSGFAPVPGFGSLSTSLTAQISELPVGSGTALTSSSLHVVPPGSDVTSVPSNQAESSQNTTPVPSSETLIGPGPLPSVSIPGTPSGTGILTGLPTVPTGFTTALSYKTSIGSGTTLAPTASIPFSSGLPPYNSDVSASAPTYSASGSSYVSGSGTSVVTFPDVSIGSRPGLPSASYSFISSTNPIPGVPPRPHPIPTYTASNSPGISYPGTTVGVEISSSPYVDTTRVSVSGSLTSGTAAGPSSGNPSSPASTPGVPGLPYVTSPVGTQYSFGPSVVPSGSGFNPSATGIEGTNTSSPALSSVEYSTQPSATPDVPITSPGISPGQGLSTTVTVPTPSSSDKGTSTTQITNVVTYPYTTFVVTVPLSTSSRNYSTETEGIHTSIGTDASAYIPTGSGWWPSATANGTVISPTPVPYNNQGVYTSTSGKSSIVAIIFALAFAHFV